MGISTPPSQGALVELDPQIEPLPICREAIPVRHLVDEGREGEVLGEQLELAPLQTPQIEEIVDQPQERFARPPNRLGVAPLALARGSCSKRSQKPSTPLSGVRSSWLMFARNSDLARLASCASLAALLWRNANSQADPVTTPSEISSMTSVSQGRSSGGASSLLPQKV